MNLYGISIIGLLAGVLGTGLGGLIAMFTINNSNKMLSITISMVGGLMLAVTCFDLIPSALNLGNLWIVFLGLASGIFFMTYIENVVRTKNIDKSKILAAGILMGFGIAIHNFPEGLAVGSGFEASTELGLKLVFIIMLHDIPEGFAMALPLKRGGVRPLKVVFYTILAGIPTGLGALTGAIVGGISKEFVSLSLSIAAGAMFYVIFAELLPDGTDLHRGRLQVMGVLFGIFAGIAISTF